MLKKNVIKKFYQWSFQQQLTLVFISSIAIFSMIGAISVTLLDWHRGYNNIIEHGTQITKDFSRKSALSLQYDIIENIEEEAKNTLNFSEVAYIEILDSKENLVIQRWNEKHLVENAKILMPHSHHGELYDDGDFIHFTEKVYSVSDTSLLQSPFSAMREEPTFLGYAHVVFSKLAFKERLYSTFIINIVIFFAFSIITLSILLFIARRLSTPLNKLALLMEQTQHGIFPKNIDISGSSEVDKLVKALNTMLVTLDERAKRLDQKNRLLLKEIDERKSAENDRANLQKQLLQAQKMEAIGQLTGGIAHDFNNILAAMLGYTQLANKIACAYNNVKLQKYLTEVINGGERAKDLVVQLLAYSRKKTREPKDNILTSISPVIDEITAMLHSIIPSSISVSCDIPDQLPKIHVDPVQLHQAILNLCINARDAMHGQGTLNINAKYYETDQVCDSCHQSFSGKYLCISIQDTGTGISPQIKDKLFEPFFTTKEIGKGSGMGLAMVHGIVHNHHGHLTVESRENEGTCFNLHFPIKVNKESKAA